MEPENSKIMCKELLAPRPTPKMKDESSLLLYHVKQK